MRKRLFDIIACTLLTSAVPATLALENALVDRTDEIAVKHRFLRGNVLMETKICVISQERRLREAQHC